MSTTQTLLGSLQTYVSLLFLIYSITLLIFWTNTTHLTWINPTYLYIHRKLKSRSSKDIYNILNSSDMGTMEISIDRKMDTKCVQFSSVVQSCPTLCDPMNRSTPGLPVHHKLLECTQTHVHRVGDAIQPSHPLLFPSPPAPNASQHQGLFQWVNSSHI